MKNSETPTYDSPLEIKVNLEAYDRLIESDESSSLKVIVLRYMIYVKRSNKY